MCGIVGYIGTQNATPILLDGLSKLEYRGYDSAGIAVLEKNGHISTRKTAGKLQNLIASLKTGNSPEGVIGIGHTRWATHGRPSDENAHPHPDCTKKLSVIHNGIIENYAELREELIAEGHMFISETDTEVLAHLIEECYKNSSANLQEAVRAALNRVSGAYAIAVLHEDHPDVLVGARYNAPLVVGIGDQELFLASDIPAILKHTRKVLFLEEGEIIALTSKGINLIDLAGNAINREPSMISWDAEAAEKGGYPHFVLKEINEQPDAIQRALLGRLQGHQVHLPEFDELLDSGKLSKISRIYVVACGTSYYAGLVAKYAIEQLAKIPVEVVTASEFRYGTPILGPDILCISITQSGETADTLASMKMAKESGAPIVTLTNVVGSAITRLADAVLYLQAGPEIGVVATKTFVSSLIVLYLLAIRLAESRGQSSREEIETIVSAIYDLPAQINQILERYGAEAGEVAIVAKAYSRYTSFMFVGRGMGFPIAMEGALKLKEISYIHAEGYPAGELKHGPIALLDPDTPLFAIATRAKTYDKVISNIQEVRARDARVVALATEGDEGIKKYAEHVFYIPDTLEILAPILQVIPLQLFSYYAAVARGCNVDQPRNLAKSVTVE